MYIIFQCFYYSHTEDFKECRIVSTKGKYMKRQFAWAFPKNSPYLNIFNFYFEKFKEKGIWHSINERYKTKPQICPDLNGKPIEYSSCFTAFLALLGSIIISFFLMLMEFCKYKMEKNNRFQDDDISKDGKYSNTSQFTLDEIEERILYCKHRIIALQKTKAKIGK